MYKETLRPAWAEINLTNLDYNIKSIKSKVSSKTEIMGIIKADGYGHGSIEVANILQENGITTFGVATLSEVMKLREAGFCEDIVLLGLTPDMYADKIVDLDITPVVCDVDNAATISEAAKKVGKVIHGYVAIDTGMGRIGYPADDLDTTDGMNTSQNTNAIADIKKMNHLSHFKIKGLFSHFATADAADKTYALEQGERYNRFYSKLIEAGISIPIRTFANSAAIMELPDLHFEVVRPGIALYGCYPSTEVDQSKLSLKPVMSVKANIVLLKKVPKGTSISYGRKFITRRDSLIATLTLGYADGLPRPYSSVGHVIINGVKAPLAGNICMDQCMVDVTDVPNVKVGDEVILLGSDGKNTILADDIGAATGTINYEIVCAFGQRLPKVWKR